MIAPNKRAYTMFLPLLVLLAVVAVACGQPAAPTDTGPAASAAADNVTATDPPAATIAAADTATEPTATVMEASERMESDIPEIAGISAWLNTDDALSIADLAADGKVVLVDFWTYTCINCIRTFPYLKLWHSRYADDGLVILGIHTPEFEFEKDYDNVVQATRDNGIIWPVAQDNDYVTWKNYSNRYWPAKYLIDQDGVVRYTHFGEGDYGETEEQIRRLLMETGAELSDDKVVLPTDQEVDMTYLNTRNAQVTPELYAGHQRAFSAALSGRGAYVVQPEYYDSRDEVVTLKAPAEMVLHKIYFNGPWSIMPESSRHARETNENEDYIALKYSAKSVNAVLTAESKQSYRVLLTMNGQALTEDNKGGDVIIGDNGDSYIEVNEARLYELVEHPQYAQAQELRMSSNSPNFGLFAFTFGIYKEGP
jgi:thiol-disulfide isomerase/thioredoxin